MARTRSAIARGSFDAILDGEGRVDKAVKKKIQKARGFADPEVAKRAALAGHATKAEQLTPRQELYVQNRVYKGMSKYEATKAAGYAFLSATRQNEENPKVQAALIAEQAGFERSMEMSRKRVMEGLLEAVDMAKIKADPLSMVAGWREIAKICGYYEPIKHKLEVSVNGQVLMHQLQSLPDEELLRLVDESTTIDGEFTVPGTEDEEK